MPITKDLKVILNRIMNTEYIHHTYMTRCEFIGVYNVSPAGERRLSAFLAAMLLPMSCFSCYYFLRGMEVFSISRGKICTSQFIKRIAFKRLETVLFHVF